VLLLDGSIVSGKGCTILTKPKTPGGFTTAMGTPRAKIHVELVIGADGSPRQPLVVSSTASPFSTFQALQYIRRWTFSPAVVDDRPVDSACQIHIAAVRS
jgi:hypothetical protein